MNYLDIKDPIINFEQTINDKIYVDKSSMIHLISNNIKMRSSKYICITRPRRFGKTINANMLGAYFTKGYDTHSLFDRLNISETENYEQHINQHHVIYINLSRMPDFCDSFTIYLKSIHKKLMNDMVEYYNIDSKLYDSISDALNACNDTFMFILDEWDSIFYKDFMTEKDKKEYLEFLNGLLKDQPYVDLAYMTGVLPIAKYSSGSALNRHCPPLGVFEEFSFMKDDIYEEYFGFHEDEVKELCKYYPKVTYGELKYWYDGYVLEDGRSLFNPRSVTSALKRGKCRNYWTETGPMNEVADCIENNVKAVREDIVNLVSEIPVKVDLEGYGASDLNLDTRDAILSAMVVYGFLSYHKGKLQIPNHELMMKFETVLERESMGEVAEIVKNSEKMLNATIKQDTESVAHYLREIHAREVPLLKYNDENSLSCVITLCYLKARDYYRVTREEHSGEGYVDFLFYPIVNGYPAIVLELKYGHSAEDAIKQIKRKNYIDQVRIYKDILLVGINYDKENKKHTCIIENQKNN